MVSWFNALFVLSAAFPMREAWRANRSTTLVYAIAWSGAAWITWSISAWAIALNHDAAVVRYLALALSGCAFMAVLGARQPGARAWNFVVFGLFTVLLLPLGERYLAGGDFTLDTLQMLLIGGVLMVGVVNYLLTSIGPAAVLLGVACCLELFAHADVAGRRWESLAVFLVGLVPWLAYWNIRRRPVPLSLFDQQWLSFRDRFGLVWGQRLRDQFNRAAVNAGWPVTLTWRGLRRKPGTPALNVDVPPELLNTLMSLMKRFGPRDS